MLQGSLMINKQISFTRFILAHIQYQTLLWAYVEGPLATVSILFHAYLHLFRRFYPIQLLILALGEYSFAFPPNLSSFGPHGHSLEKKETMTFLQMESLKFDGLQ